MVKDVHKIDLDRAGKPLFGSKAHVHFKDGRAMNLDGTWRHGEGDADKRVIEWIVKAIDFLFN